MEKEQDMSTDFVDILMGMHRQQVEAMVYLARHQGLHAGVRPNTHSPQPGDEQYPPIKRVVFIEFPEQTIEWPFTETDKNTAWLDSLPQ
jgi:hypothetical protein